MFEVVRVKVIVFYIIGVDVWVAVDKMPNSRKAHTQT